VSNIQLLDPYLISQIAAGEVIERPASVLKELLENSLDAQAKNIEIDVLQGGTELIRIRDDGCGIPKEELDLALKRHATSKIAKFEDLEKVLTLGFRGEALASIASVARLTLTSRTPGESAAWRIMAEGGEPKSSGEPIAHPFGTTVEVRDLFFITPVRRKFLRTPSTEFRHIQEVVTRLALSRFDVGFILKHNDKLVFKLQTAETPEEKLKRMAFFCGEDFGKETLEVENIRPGLKLTGLIGKPTFARSQTDLQYFYINGRMVRDKILSHAVRAAYQDVLAPGKQPAFVLYLEIDPELVDVNVHPTKQEVRFRETRTIHDFLSHSLKQTLARTNFKIEKDIPNEKIMWDLPRKKDVMQRQEPVGLATDVSEWKKLAALSQKSFPEITASPEIDESRDEKHSTPSQVLEKLSENSKNSLGEVVAQLHGLYILAQSNAGLVLIDMHAAHERITYEKLKESFSQNKITTQSLLIPLPIKITHKESAVFTEHQDELKKLGLDLEMLGDDTLLVRQMPVLLKTDEVEAFVREVLADLAAYEVVGDKEIYRDKILKTFACHHSIRANRKMTLPEMNELLRQLEKTARGAQCNHGRPTWVQITWQEVAKMFAR